MKQPGTPHHISLKRRGYLIVSINSFRDIPVAFEISSSIEYSVPILSCAGKRRHENFCRLFGQPSGHGFQFAEGMGNQEIRGI